MWSKFQENGFFDNILGSIDEENIVISVDFDCDNTLNPEVLIKNGQININRERKTSLDCVKNPRACQVMINIAVL